MRMQRTARALSQSLPPRPQVSSTAGLTKATSLDQLLRCGAAELSFDDKSGAIAHLKFQSGSAAGVWATAGAPLFDLRYMTYTDRSNLTCTTNTTKGHEQVCANPVAGSWSPSFVSVHHNCSASPCTSCRIVTESRFNSTLNGGKYGAPSTVWTEFTLVPAERQVSVVLKLFGKTSTRLPESTVLIFQPQKVMPRREGYGWAMDVLSSWVDPYDVASGGEQQVPINNWPMCVCFYCCCYCR